MIVDGGTKDSGNAIVEHVRKYYGTSTVNYVVNTHPDGDHASGLSTVLEQLTVNELWIHRPWKYSSEIRDLFKDKRMTDNSLAERLKKSLGYAYALEELANEKEIPIYEPFQGEHIGAFSVISPSNDTYLDLIPSFAKTPEQKEEEPSKPLTEAALNKLETWYTDTLSENVTTSAENESSVVLYGKFNNNSILLTGDAGIQALTEAANYAEKNGINLKNCECVQVPHHGSRHNVTPSILDRIIGTTIQENSTYRKCAYVNVAKGSTEYPRKVVANAFTRRGVGVFTTANGNVCYRENMPDREGWYTISPLPFYSEVEK